jgi:hypothetical protein
MQNQKLLELVEDMNVGMDCLRFGQVREELDGAALQGRPRSKDHSCSTTSGQNNSASLCASLVLERHFYIR